MDAGDIYDADLNDEVTRRVLIVYAAVPPARLPSGRGARIAKPARGRAATMADRDRWNHLRRGHVDGVSRSTAWWSGSIVAPPTRSLRYVG